jgi:heme/copper-type cytochrome/quinol oxidase subunit 2
MRRAPMLLLATLVATAGFAGSAPHGAVAAKAAGCTTEGGRGEHGSAMDMDDHGSSSTNCPTVKGARVIRVTGDRFQFIPKNLTVAAGEDVTIRLSSDDITHDFYVKSIGHVVHAKAGQTTRGGLRIDDPGTYKFWCTVANHKLAGMTGRIKVS